MSGASSGIGEALARHYARDGVALGLAARRQDALDALAATLPGERAVYPLDVTDTAALERAARDFMARFGAPQLVIANAGVSVGTHGDDPRDIAKLRRLLEVNVTGLAATLAAFAPAMRAARSGTLCGIASVAGFRGLPGSGAYSASKAAAIAWLESLRMELRRSGVAVVTICPGFVDTPMTRVNRYRMPFRLPAAEFARRAARAIEARRPFAVIPWQMGIVGRVLRVLPAPLYDRLFARAGRKRRDLTL
ncbi:MAG: SDR family oxidoreductase [Betaproteobacteria bacterium]|nr:MAG: SDR family oxidoreductase [Betaproteobacteria bacterium]